MDNKQYKDLIKRIEILEDAIYTIDRDLKIDNGRNITLGRSIGTKIGTDTDQKVGFFGTDPVEQQTYSTSSTDIANALRNIGIFN